MVLVNSVPSFFVLLSMVTRFCKDLVYSERGFCSVLGELSRFFLTNLDPSSGGLSTCLSRLLAMSLLVVCLVVRAWPVSLPVEAAVRPSTGNRPGFVAKLKPLLQAKMKQSQIPGAMIFVDLPGQGSWTTTMGTSDLTTKAPMKVNS
jgi:hypothetical protein